MQFKKENQNALTKIVISSTLNGSSSKSYGKAIRIDRYRVQIPAPEAR